MSAISLRPYLPADATRAAEIVRASIEALTAEDYDADQRAAWSGAADDERAFGARLAGLLTLVASQDGDVVGFVALKSVDRLDMLYVAPESAGARVGTTLCEAIEKLAAARGAKEIVVEASDNSRGFFERRGYGARSRNSVSIGGEWLANTTMAKRLTAGASR